VVDFEEKRGCSVHQSGTAGSDSFLARAIKGDILPCRSRNAKHLLGDWNWDMLKDT